MLEIRGQYPCFEASQWRDDYDDALVRNNSLHTRNALKTLYRAMLYVATYYLLARLE